MTIPLPFVGPQFDADSLCAEIDPDIWFPDVGGSVRAAKQMCHRCENEDACLEWALVNEEHFGVWGGKSETERRSLLRDRQKEARLRGIKHGTDAGYRAHQRRGDVVPYADPCGCRAASRLAAQERRKRAAA